MSMIWNYTAIRKPESGALLTQRQGRRAAPERIRGEVAGSSAAEVRASLRRVGLQVVDLKLRGATSRRTEAGKATSQSMGRMLASAIAERMESHLRTRRRPQRSDFFDGLATMLDSGLPLLDAIETLLDSKNLAPGGWRRLLWQGGSTRSGGAGIMLTSVREQLKGGASLDQTLAAHPTWFDATEVAMVRAAQHSGNLAPVLRRLTEQHERAGELGQKLASALAYPCIIAMVGLGVVVFLSIKTLPDLARILENAGIAVPALTEHVIGFGTVIAAYWPAMFLCVLLLLAMATALPALIVRWTRGGSLNLMPKVIRRMAVAGFSLRLSDLLRTGVPVVEALRVLKPTVSSHGLKLTLADAADRVERGEDLSSSLAHPAWFDAEYTRLIEIGQASGELDVLLERLGRRYERSARRLIDRLATLLEPAVILALAALIGVVVMAAILPLTRLQEVLQ